jgi:PilZ domain-containing protein
MRRWPRHEANLPVQVALLYGMNRTVVPGRGTEISEGGMALYAGVDLKLHDLMDVEFLTPSRACVTGIVRNRSGYCFGLEFLSPLSAEGDLRSPALPAKVAVRPVDEPGFFSPTAAAMFEKIKSTQGNDVAYALLAQALQAGGFFADARKAADLAAAFFLQSRNTYLRQKEGEIRTLRKEIEALRRVEPLLHEAYQQGQMLPGLPELISVLPDLLNED